MVKPLEKYKEYSMYVGVCVLARVCVCGGGGIGVGWRGRIWEGGTKD